MNSSPLILSSPRLAADCSPGLREASALFFDRQLEAVAGDTRGGEPGSKTGVLGEC
jgi:hypothetical protein